MQETCFKNLYYAKIGLHVLFMLMPNPSRIILNRESPRPHYKAHIV